MSTITVHCRAQQVHWMRFSFEGAWLIWRTVVLGSINQADSYMRPLYRHVCFIIILLSEASVTAIRYDVLAGGQPECNFVRDYWACCFASLQGSAQVAQLHNHVSRS